MFLKIFQKKISGVAFLPVILLVGGLSVVIIAAIVLVSVETNSSQARTKWATEAFTLSQSGIDDGITKIIRDKNCPDANCPDSYTFSGGNGIVVVTIEKDTPTSGKYTITSCAKVRTVQKQMQAVVSVDPTTGQVETELVSESSATICVSEASGPCAGISPGTSGTLNNQTVYCDKHNHLWTPTANIGGSATIYAWGPKQDEPDNSCIGKGVSYSACNYCDNLTYAGFDDWQLPSCASKAPNSNCILYQFGIDACGGYLCTPSWDMNARASDYWSSTEYTSYSACCVGFNYGNVGSDDKGGSYYVRCVRGQ